AVCDASGKELARAEAAPGPVEALLRFTAPADGTYLVRVADRFHARGGPAYAYRLRLGRTPAPDFRLLLATDALSVPVGGQGKLKLQVERVGGLAEPIALAVEGLPRSVTVTPLTMAANQPAVDLAFKADAPAAIDVSRLTIRGTAKTGSGEV